ncbi:MAG: hypothetical protein ACPGED_10290 [Flavobacteriales bacterium]
MNSKELLFIGALLLLPFIGQSQYVSPSSDLLSPRLKPTHLNVGIGLEHDRYNNMSLNQLMMMAENPSEMQRDLNGFSEDIGTTTAGVGLFARVSFALKDEQTGTYREDREIQIGLALHSPREAMVTYNSVEMDSSIVFCNINSEITLDAAYLFKGDIGKRTHWKIGLGSSIGGAFDREMILISGRSLGPDEHPSQQDFQETNRETFSAKPVMYSRLYVPYGLYVDLGQNMQLGFDARTGIGAQFIQGEKANFINKTGAFILGVKYAI